MYHVQCTMYIVQCTMYNVQCTMYHVQCTMYNVHGTMYNVTDISIKKCSNNRFKSTERRNLGLQLLEDLEMHCDLALRYFFGVI